MLRDILTNKWVISGFSFLIVIGIGCYFWYQHELAPYRQDAAETTKVARKLEAAQKVDTKNEMEPVSEEKLITEAASETRKKDADLSKIQANLAGPRQETENVEEVPVSPHGFGPFPEVPDDYIIKPFSWDFYKNDPPIYELMARVRIKLWKQGVRTTGITSSSATGLVYPTIPGAVFVKKYSRDGIDHLEIRGDPTLDLDAIRKSLMDGNVPDGVTVLDLDDAGIDPYTFLNLKK